MVDATDRAANDLDASPAVERSDTVPARLARCAGEVSCEKHGWTWRGRLPAEAVADLLRRALTHTPLAFAGPATAPSHVHVQAIWFDAALGIVACELVAGDTAAGPSTECAASVDTSSEAADGAPGGARLRATGAERT